MAEVIGFTFVGMTPLRCGIYLHAAHEISEAAPAAPRSRVGLIIVLLHGLSSVSF